MATRPARPVLVGPVRIQTQGNVPRDARILAAAKIRWLLRHAPEPVVWGRVTLTTAADPAAELPAIARASLALDGRTVRAGGGGASMSQAIEQLDRRLRYRLARAAYS